MALVATDVDICNLALDAIGQKPITVLSAAATASLQSQVCERHYITTRRELLRRYIFNFAKKYTVLTKNAVTPAYGYATAFDLPTDFIRLLALGETTINADTPPGLYTLSEGDIFTDHEDNTDQINMEYIKDATLVSEYDSLFVTLLAQTLAMKIVYKFTLKASLVRNLKEMLGDTEHSAAAVAGQEKPPRRIQHSKLRDRRRFGSRFRDTTRHP